MALSKYFSPEALQKPAVWSFYFRLHRTAWSPDQVGWALWCVQEIRDHFNQYFPSFTKNPSLPITAQTTITYQTVVAIVQYVHRLDEEFEGWGVHELVFGNRKLYGKDVELGELGLAKNDRGESRRQEVTDFEQAAILLECFYDAVTIDYKKLEQEVGHPAPVPVEDPDVPSTEQAITSGGLPIIPGGGSGSKKDERDEKTKKEDEEKKKQEEERKKQEKPVEQNDFKNLVNSDRLFRREVYRIQSAITHQMAAAYGISDAQYGAFEAEVARHITPIVLVKLNSLDAATLEKTLENSTDLRLKLYQQTLSSLQRSLVFRAALTQAAAKAKHIKPEQVVQPGDDLGKLADGVKTEYSKELDRERTRGEESPSPLSTSEISAILKDRGISSGNLESSLRELLRQNRNITESQDFQRKYHDLSELH
jgi:hypothetical protein